MIQADVIRAMLLVDITALALLALVYLRQRRMSLVEYCFWGLVAVILPVLGPFFVIVNRPGQWEPSYSIRADARRVSGWLGRLLPGSPQGSRLQRARARRKKQQQVKPE